MANAISLIRVGMVLAAIALLYHSESTGFVVAMVLIAAAILMDGVDGWIARKRGTTSRFGAVLDIAGDRVIENVLWIAFADLNLLTVWVPITIVTRGIMVDAVRSMGLGEGKTPFGKETMMRGQWATRLTAGRFMRALYGLSKLWGFVFLAGLVGYEQANLASTSLGPVYDSDLFRGFGWVMVWTSVVLSIVRGLPVIWEARGLLNPRLDSHFQAQLLARAQAESGADPASLDTPSARPS